MMLKTSDGRVFSLLRPGAELVRMLGLAHEWVQAHPEQAQRFRELLHSLLGKSPAEQQAIVDEALRVVEGWAAD